MVNGVGKWVVEFPRCAAYWCIATADYTAITAAGGDKDWEINNFAG